MSLLFYLSLQPSERPSDRIAISETRRILHMKVPNERARLCAAKNEAFSIINGEIIECFSTASDIFRGFYFKKKRKKSGSNIHRGFNRGLL
mmetsp:Transcript_28461/g.44086  ORF Transcript_28461/g.44086 Transcript_28461/m.44086 type:complete len:91 (-) Transcript_28461:92-364(-)